MRIAQIAPLYESVPPRTYGGTERVVHYLTEALVQQGHEVTLYASADSRTSARLRPTVPEALRLSKVRRDALPWHLLQLAEIAREAGEYDIVHFHTDLLHFPLSRKLEVPQLTTLHGRLDLPDLKPLYQEFRDMPVVSIADHQRMPLPMARWAGTVYHGLPADLYTFRPDEGDYLAFLGRISPEKGPEQAIEIAVKAGMPLKIAAKVDEVDRAYFEERVEPLLSHPLVEFIGEVDERGKNELLGGARALLFPIRWPEPFGLVMIEAMACGTPVIAFRHGSVPEIVRDGINGYIVDSVEAAVEAIGRTGAIDRAACRAYFDERFTADRMARDYVRLYREQGAQRLGAASDHARRRVPVNGRRAWSPSVRLDRAMGGTQRQGQA